jgi:hypothetical protein
MRFLTRSCCTKTNQGDFFVLPLFFGRVLSEIVNFRRELTQGFH